MVKWNSSLIGSGEAETAAGDGEGGAAADLPTAADTTAATATAAAAAATTATAAVAAEASSCGSCSS